MEEHLAYLAANPDAADRHERVRALVECPQPLASLLSGRFAAADPAMRKLMLEVIDLAVLPDSNPHELSLPGSGRALLCVG